MSLARYNYKDVNAGVSCMYSIEILNDLLIYTGEKTQHFFMLYGYALSPWTVAVAFFTSSTTI